MCGQTRMKTYTHTCGQVLTLVLRPYQHDVTGFQDVPSHMRGLPLERVPKEYHVYVKTGDIIGWMRENEQVYTCPTCHASLPSGMAYTEKDLNLYLDECNLH